MDSSATILDDYDFVDHDETRLSPEVISKIRDWLQPTDYLAESGEFRRHLSSQAPGTGLWICETDEYRKWHDSDNHGSLWIKGVPGAGKSVMAAAIIQHLQETEHCPVLFFFFRNIVSANFSPRALIRDWLAQLLPHSAKLQNALQLRLDTNLEETSDADLMQIFLDGSSSIPKMYCIGDALDEMTVGNLPFLRMLNNLAALRPRSLKLLMTSRPERYLQTALVDSAIVHFSLQRRLVDADILLYLQHRLARSPKPDNVRQKVIDMVAARSEGLFLYAKLAMDQLEAVLEDGAADISTLEASLPIGLEQTYASMLAKQRRKEGVDIHFQVLALKAVTHASRPLRLNELKSLFQCIRPDHGAANLKSLVATCCGQLVEVLEDETMQIIHHSFTEFLRGDIRSATETDSSSSFPIINSEMAHRQMAMSCLHYLQSGVLLLENERLDGSSADPSVAYNAPSHHIDPDKEHYRRSHLGIKEEKDGFDYQRARLLHPFLSYAVENWSYHASKYDQHDEEFAAAVLGFLQPNSLAFRRWLVLQWGSTSTSKESTEGIPTALHVAAYTGLSHLALDLLEKGSSITAVDAQQRIPLHWAAAKGHTKLASLLIEHGSDPNAEDGRGLKPIHLAAQKNDAAIVKVLLEAGVEPNTVKTKENHAGRLLGGERVTKGECAILYACQGGHIETLITMIPFCTPEVLTQLLCECCRFGRSEAVDAILAQTSVSIDTPYQGATALYFACGAANVQCVAALLSKGADVQKVSNWEPRRTINGGGRRSETLQLPLHRLVRIWNDNNFQACQAILPMLVSAGTNLEQPESAGHRALHIAAGAFGHYGPSSISVSAITALLNAGADAKSVDRHGNTALHVLLSKHRDPEGVRLLVEHGSDPNERGSSGETALQRSMTQTGMVTGIENTETIVKYLLDKGADPNLADKHGNTAIHQAISAGSKIFQMVLSSCEDVAVKRQCWFGLANTHNPEGFTATLELLLADGIDINAKRRDGRTLYLCCLTSEDRLAILRSYGADMNAVDNAGNNAAHIICQNNICLRGPLEKLIADGVDPLATNNNGDTLLHHLAGWYTGEQKVADYVRWIVSLGIPVNAVNKKGLTALHVSQGSSPRFGRGVQGDARVYFVDAIGDQSAAIIAIRDQNGLSALHMAAMRYETELDALISAGADLAALTGDSQSVLHLVCRAREPGILSQILDYPSTIDLNQKDSFGRTPLHYACSSGDPESVKILIKRGADVHAVDNDGCTTMHACAQSKLEQRIWYAQRKRSPWLRGPLPDPLRPGAFAPSNGQAPWYQWPYPVPEIDTISDSTINTIAEMLLNAGSDVGAVNKSSFTALDVALNFGCTGVIEVFARSEELFVRATERLNDDERSRDEADDVRQRMKTQMLLMLPGSSAISTHNGVLTEDVTKQPLLCLQLLSTEEAARVIDEGFRTSPFQPSYYDLLHHLLTSDAMRVAERLPGLLMHYSSYTSLLEKSQRAKKAGERLYKDSALTALQIACGSPRSNLLILQLLVEDLKVDVNATCAEVGPQLNRKPGELGPGGTALHILAQAEHYWQTEGLKYLLAHGADANARNQLGQTPLHIAAAGEKNPDTKAKGFWRVNATRILLEHGADPNILDKQGLSAVHKASDSPKIMRELLQGGADPMAGTTNPLFAAIYDQNLGALQTLLDHGLSPDSIDEKRHSRNVHYELTTSRTVYAVLCAAYASKLNTGISKSVPLLQALLLRGADLYVALNDTETLVHFLFEFPEYEVSDTLLKTPCVDRIDFNRRDQQGRTVLMAACDWREVLPGYAHKHWDPKVPGSPLRILDLGADATLIDHTGKTALHRLLDNSGMPDDVLLQFLDRDEVAPTLLVKDAAGYSPLHYALLTLRPDVCQSLLSKGADLMEPDPCGLTALHHVAMQCYNTTRRPRASGRLTQDLPKDYFEQCLKIWETFISQGGSINQADHAGNTPLHTYLLSGTSASARPSSSMCHVEKYDKLFPEDSGVDIFATNHDGETALHIISRREETFQPGHDKAMFEAMMSKGLDPLKEDAQGRSALDVASACNKGDIVALFKRT